jgi:hypothetical protein
MESIGKAAFGQPFAFFKYKGRKKQPLRFFL